MIDPNCVDEEVEEALRADRNPFAALKAAKETNPAAYVTAPVYVAALAALWDLAQKASERVEGIAEANHLWDGR